MSLAKSFRTSEILASIHSFPALMAARDKAGVIESFDRLRAISPEIAGIDFATDHLGWCDLSLAMREPLRQHFTALAAERIPDSSYWSNPRSIDPQKMERLGAWVEKMEAKYGATLEVPDISAAVRANLKNDPGF